MSSGASADPRSAKNQPTSIEGMASSLGRVAMRGGFAVDSGTGGRPKRRSAAEHEGASYSRAPPESSSVNCAESIQEYLPKPTPLQLRQRAIRRVAPSAQALSMAVTGNKVAATLLDGGDFEASAFCAATESFRIPD
jgi:hypothetical protein